MTEPPAGRTPPPLAYARPDISRRPSPVDGVISVLAAVQLMLAVIIFGAILNVGSVGAEPRWATAVRNGWPEGVAYATLSVVALVGSCRADPRKRRPFYRTYLVGLPVAAGVLTAAVVAIAGGSDPDVYWQMFVLSGIVNPAWLLLVVRGVRSL